MASSHLRVSVGVSFPPELLDEIEEEVGDDMSRSAFIRKAVREHMDADNNE